jgi:hypothetical protein
MDEHGSYVPARDRRSCPAVIQARTGCTEVKSTSKHWPCLFPRHGPGRKHERAIELEPRQAEIVARNPGDFARGLFHSDGCRLMNRVRRRLQAATAGMSIRGTCS